MKRLSIIIPVYKVEPFIERCIVSLENQDIDKNDYEIICINDGSPDKSREIIARLGNEFNNITLIDQENQGVSRARNNGIDKATGNYILFIDPDDYVLPETFSGILEKTDKFKAQVSFLGFTVIDEMGKVVHDSHNDNIRSIYQGIDIYSLARGDGRTDPDRTVAILFSLDFIKTNDIRYLPNVPYLEDGEMIARILCLADRCIFDGRPFYQRTTRPESATHSDLFFSEKAKKGFLLAASNLNKFQNEERLVEMQRVFLNQPIAKFVLLVIHSTAGNKGSSKLKDAINELKDLGFVKLKLKGCNRMPFIFNGFAYNISPYLSSLTLKLYPKCDMILMKLIKAMDKIFSVRKKF